MLQMPRAVFIVSLESFWTIIECKNRSETDSCGQEKNEDYQKEEKKAPFYI